MASTSIELQNARSMMEKPNLHLRPVEADDDIVVANSRADQDQIDLARAGKKQVLKRNFGLTSMTGFSCGLMCTWEGLLTGFVLGFDNGGPAGLIYGFLFTWLGTLSVFTVMGELSSMVPTASGQYHWVNYLAPPSSRRFLSYMTGWLTVAGWVAALAATAFFSASLIVGVVQLNYPDFNFQSWQETLTFWAVLILCIVVNTVASRALPAIEIVILILHVLGFFAFIIPLAFLPEHKSGKEVFTTFNNMGGWSTQALSFFIGLQGNANAFVGADGAVHMSEEVKNASKNVARSMTISIIVNGALAFGILLSILFCAVSDDIPEDALYPFIPIIASAIGSNVAASVLTAVVIVLVTCAAIGSLAASSRMIWAFARDRGIPGWRRLSQVNEKTTVPVLGILVVAGIAALIGFINLGSTTAFNDVISLTLEGLFTSYLMACVLLLYRRVRGQVRVRCEDDGGDMHEGKGTPYFWGPWRIPGFFGIANNLFACIYLVIISFFSFWPTTTPTPAADMNYSQTVWGAVIIFSLLYYVFRAKKYYTGPVVEVEVLRADF